MSSEVPIIILVISIPVFFIIRRILKKYINNNSRRTLVSMVVTLITAPLIYSVLIIVFFSILFYEPQLDFNKERWMKIEQGRYKMRDDLVDSKILNGKTKKEVIDLIGRSRSADSTNVWTYDLGTSGAGLGWQFNYLEIKFANDKVNTVKKIEIVD